MKAKTRKPREILVKDFESKNMCVRFRCFDLSGLEPMERVVEVTCLGGDPLLSAKAIRRLIPQLESAAAWIEEG